MAIWVKCDSEPVAREEQGEERWEMLQEGCEEPDQAGSWKPLLGHEDGQKHEWRWTLIIMYLVYILEKPPASMEKERPEAIATVQARDGTDLA